VYQSRHYYTGAVFKSEKTETLRNGHATKYRQNCLPKKLSDAKQNLGLLTLRVGILSPHTHAHQLGLCKNSSRTKE